MASIDSSVTGTSGSSYHTESSQPTTRMSGAEITDMNDTAKSTSAQSVKARKQVTKTPGVPHNYVQLSKCAILYHLDLYTAGRARENYTKQDAAADILEYKELFYYDQKSKQIKKREPRQVSMTSRPTRCISLIIPLSVACGPHMVSDTGTHWRKRILGSSSG